MVNLFSPAEILEWGRGVFALILAALVLYSWAKRKQPGLLIVAVAFFLFFTKTFVDEFVRGIPFRDDLFNAIDFVILALFFLAIVFRPKRNGAKTDILGSP